MTLPLFQNRKIHFPKELEHLGDYKELMDQIKYTTEEGFGGHDDGPDGISMLTAMEVMYPSARRDSRESKRVLQSEESKFWDKHKEDRDVNAYESYI